MIATSFSTRALHFAYLLGPPRLFSRQDGMAIHDAICGALGVDDITFRYSTVPGEGGQETAGSDRASRVFSIQMERQIGRGKLKVLLDCQSQQAPIRFLMQYIWPRSGGEYAYEEFDLISDATFDSLGSLGPGLQRVMAEGRVRGHMATEGNSAVTFLVEQTLHLNRERIDSLEAPPDFVVVGFNTPAGDPSPEDPLRQPKREVRIEVLREDSRSLYIELMSQWPQVTTAPNGTATLDTQRLRAFSNPPSDYLRNCHEYLANTIFPLFGG